MREFAGASILGRCDSGPAADIGVLMGKCMVPRYDISFGPMLGTLEVEVEVEVEGAKIYSNTTWEVGE